jgi:hypothetical protein
MEIGMTTSNLERIVEEVKTLTPDEQRSLRDMVDELLVKSASTMTEEELEQHLLRKGVISRIPPRIRDANFEANRKLIEVEGKPVSETSSRSDGR